MNRSSCFSWWWTYDTSQVKKASLHTKLICIFNLPFSASQRNDSLAVILVTRWKIHFRWCKLFRDSACILYRARCDAILLERGWRIASRCNESKMFLDCCEILIGSRSQPKFFPSSSRVNDEPCWGILRDEHSRIKIKITSIYKANSILPMNILCAKVDFHGVSCSFIIRVTWIFYIIILFLSYYKQSFVPKSVRFCLLISKSIRLVL